MMHKEIAQRLRELDETGNWGGVQALADELDPPLPEPGTVVWWQDFERLGDPVLGRFNDLGRIELFGSTQLINPASVKYWPARILGSGEVAVDVPPVSGWPNWAEAMEWRFISPVTFHDRPFITRTEAERLEAER